MKVNRTDPLVSRKKLLSDIYDYAIVGAGLAGSSAAACLCEHGSVVIIDPEDSTFVGSSAPAGLFNPVMTRQGVRIWNATETLESFHRLVDTTNSAQHVLRSGILRPAITPRQAKLFVNASNESSDLCRWLNPEQHEEQFVDVHAPFGSLLVTAGGSVSIPEYVASLRRHASKAGVHSTCDTVESIAKESETHFRLKLTNDYDRSLRARVVVLCLGIGHKKFGPTKNLRLHGIKGQTIVIERPDGLSRLPALLGTGYVVDDGKRLVAGSSYAHEFDSADVDPEVSISVRKKVSGMLPSISDAEIVRSVAGVRTSVKDSYLPMVGRIDEEQPDLWFVNGLGSKGLLMSAWVAQNLEAMINQSKPVPDEFSIQYLS